MRADHFLSLLLVAAAAGVVVEGRGRRKRDPMVRKMLHGHSKHNHKKGLRGTISANPSSSHG